jgi:DNA-binding XRE family transcriptional regulator
MATVSERHAGGRPRTRALCKEGRAIEAAATGLGLTRQDIADKVGVSYVTIMRILVGDQQPAMTTAKKIAKAVGLKIGDIWVS